ncbi:MAG: beta-N-acetylhexosaminidase [Acidobacteriaceae bacterium]
MSTHNTMTLRNDIGQLLIVGVAGSELDGTERAWLKLIAPAGVILFRRNVESAAQTHALLSNVRSLAGEPLFRCVDVEGGLVDRLRDAVAPIPAPAMVAQTGDPKLFTQHGRLIGRELRLLGFNVTFAPVLDLSTAASAEVMRTRVVATTPQGVIAYARAFLKGLRRERVLGCGKHFPGLGGGTLDSHHATPRIDRTWKPLWSEDMAPYRKLRGVLPFIMVSHAAYPQATKNAELLPASISPFWIRRVLLSKIGYSGLIISDDMEMGGILHHAPIEEAAIAAIAAGTHLIEICKDPALILRAYEALLREAESSPAFRRIVEGTAAKVRRSKRQLLGRDSLAKPPSLPEVQAVRESIERFSAHVAAATDDRL